MIKLISDSYICNKNLRISIGRFSLFLCLAFAGSRIPAHAQSNLYLTTDKTWYQPSETIWFAAYLFPITGKLPDSLQNSMLSVFLKKEQPGISIKKNYLMQGNLCAGSLFLPDTIEPGNYNLIAFTNKIRNDSIPVEIFSLPLVIQSPLTAPFNTGLKISHELSGEDSLLIDVNVLLSGYVDSKKSPAVHYQLGNLPKKQVTLKAGHGIIKLSKSEVKNSNSILQTTTTYNGESKKSRLLLPIDSSNSTQLKFYPEGGNCVTGLNNHIAFEAKNRVGIPIQSKVAILKDGVAIDTVSTNTRGIGMFTLRPDSNAVYSADILEYKKTSSKPVLIPTGWKDGVIKHVEQAVVNNTLDIRLESSSKKNIKFVIASLENDNNSIATEPLAVNRLLNVKLALGNVPRGINKITVLDEQGRPLTERLFYAHYNRTNAYLQTDTSVYQTKSKVTLKLNIKDSDKSLGAVFTTSCSLLNVLKENRKENINFWYYLGRLMYSDNPIVMDDNNMQIEELLLVRGWRRYIWPDKKTASENITALTPEGILYTTYGKKIKKSVKLIIYKDSTYSTLTTNANGHFQPTLGAITVREGESAIIRTTNDIPRLVKIDDVTFPIAQKIGQLMDDSLPISAALNLNSTRMVTESMEPVQGVTMQTIVVKAVQNLYGGKGMNACGDYVCVSGYLNCPRHAPNDPDNQKPLVGKTYIFHPNQNRKPTVYEGCQALGYQKSEIYTAREFYGMDSATLTDPMRKEYLSTIYWKPFTILKRNNASTITFYTSDLPGTYKIFVEGIADNGDVFYQEKIITVTKPDTTP